MIESRGENKLINADKITMIDDAFSSYLLDPDEEEFTKKVSSILSAFANQKTFRVTIVKTTPREKEPFFGMRIFPDRGYADGLLKDLTVEEKPSIKKMCDRWRSIPIWEIEIDERVFDRTRINFNPQELSAMVLHEIGHTVYSDKKFEMFYRVYKEAQVRLKTTEKASAQLMYFLYLIPLTLMCGMRDWKVDEGDLREEVFADQSVKKLGYGEHLISAYQKIIKAYGSGGFSSDKNAENTISKSVEFCNLNIVDLLHRKNKLKDELYRTGISHNSGYIRNMISDIMNKMGIARKDKYDGCVVLESQMSAHFDDPDFLEKNELLYDMKSFNSFQNRIQAVQNIAKTAIAEEAFGRNKKNEIPSQLDVDTISVEIDRMQNHADRRYLLDLIYHQEEKINHFLELCEMNKSLKSKYYDKMQSMLRELESMRLIVLSKRSFDKQYKLFVRYPEGYEG